MTVRRIVLRCLCLAAVALVLGGCMAMTVAGAAVSVGATAVGVATDVVVGTVKVTGKVVGAVLPGGGPDK